MRRTVELRSVETYHWSTSALCWGIDVEREERVAFAVPLNEADWLRERLETEEAPRLNVSELDLLYAHRT